MISMSQALHTYFHAHQATTSSIAATNHTILITTSFGASLFRLKELFFVMLNDGLVSFLALPLLHVGM